MHDACPTCGHFVDVTQGQLTSCPGCGHWWIPGEVLAPATAPPTPEDAPTALIEDDEDDTPPEPRAARPPAGAPLEALRAPLPERPHRRPAGGAFEFEVQYAEGDQWKGPFDHFGIREMLYVGRLTGDEQIREPGATAHSRLADRPEFDEVLTLLGKKEQTGAHRHSIAGWKRSKAAPAAAPAPADPAAAPASTPAPAAADRAPAEAPAPAPAQPAPPADAGGGKGLLIAGGVGLLLLALGAAAFFAT